jgi:fumarate reductase subunit D
MGDSQKDKLIQEGTFFAIISYISFLCIVALVLKKDNKFALYHAKQGLVLFVFEVAAFIVSIIPWLGWLVARFGLVIFSLFSIWGILQALMGNYNRFPIVSDIADKIII